VAPTPARHAGALTSALGSVANVIEVVPTWLWLLVAGLVLLVLLVSLRSYIEGRRRRALVVTHRQVSEDLEVLQASLVPPVRGIEALAASAAYLPAQGLASGGDFYDVFPLNDGRLAFLLGDVSGHGREAIGQATLARYTIRAFLSNGESPADSLLAADRSLAAELDLDSFVTAIAGVYDPSSHLLTYAKAGHHAPIFIGNAHDGEADPTGPPLGSSLALSWPQTTVALTAGARVCLFTDGLIEARHGEQLLGREWLEELLRNHDYDGPELLTAVCELADSITDDLAVCLLTRPLEPVAVRPVVAARPALPAASRVA
jgi:serine phosphatase RsbU (regulator of sigma subunit)